MTARAVRRSELASTAVEVAPRLLGAVLHSRVGGPEVALRITEVEAYEGPDDPASHAFRGVTPRTAVMFGEPGHLYVYFTYGMHWCANVVCGPPGEPSAVLLRAGEVIAGHDVARERRAAARSDRDLARGPARLAQALGFAAAQNGVDLCRSGGVGGVWLGPLTDVGPGVVRSGPRVGISVAVERPWRFWLDGERSVSSFRPGRVGPARSDRAN